MNTHCVSFALTALDFVREFPVPGLDGAFKPDWSAGGPSLSARVPVVRLFGVTRESASVCAHVHGVRPHFYAELSEAKAAALLADAANMSGARAGMPATETLPAASTQHFPVELTGQFAGQLARDIEFAIDRQGARVVGLRVERWCSAYGLRLDDSPFLRVDLVDSRDVSPAAAAVQRGDVQMIGIAQPHEANLPYLLQFLADHHLTGAGWVSVSGRLRSDVNDSENVEAKSPCGNFVQPPALSAVSCCVMELDVLAPEGFPSFAERAALLCCAGPRSEVRARTYLRAMIDRGGSHEADKVRTAIRREGATPPGALTQLNTAASKASSGACRPSAGAKTTPQLSVRSAIHQWLLGGETPGAVVAQSESQQANVFSAREPPDRQDLMDIEDLASTPPPTRSATVCRTARPPPGYSDPADDPRIHNACESLPACNTNKYDGASSGSRDDVGIGALQASLAQSSNLSKAVPEALLPVVAANVSSATPVPALVGTREVATPETSTGATEPEWEDLCGTFSVEVLTALGCISGDTAANMANDIASVSFGNRPPAATGATANTTVAVAAAEPIIVVAYAWWPRVSTTASQSQNLKRQLVRGALVVERQNTASLSSDMDRRTGDVRIVQCERELFEEFVKLVRDIDPDLCFGWNLHSGSWGRLFARATALGYGNDLRIALSRTPFVADTSGRSNFGSHANKTLSLNKGELAGPPEETGCKRGALDLPFFANYKAQQSVPPVPLPQAIHSSSFASGSSRGTNGENGETKTSADMSNFDSETIAASDLQLPGRLVLNVWRILTHVDFGTKLRSYAPQEAARELLSRSFPLIPPSELARVWAKADSQGRSDVLCHLQDLAALSLEVLDHLGVLPLAGELARLTGMDVLSCFTRGSQIRVESLLVRVAHAAGFLLLCPSHMQVRSQPALECLPLVMEPASGYYWDPVLVLDYKSMYPSLIIAHNISFDTCLGRARRAEKGPVCRMGVRDEPWLLGCQNSLLQVASDFNHGSSGTDCAVRVLPTGVMIASPNIRHGLLPLMLAEVLRLRFEAKAAMRTADGVNLQRLQQRQLALKLFANVTYGYTGASFSGRMPCAEVADAIVGCGRRALEEAANFIEAAEPGARVIYGDTDSIFVHLPGATLEEAFKVGRRFSQQVSALHPAPVELEFEKVYMPSLCVSKKRYAGLAYTKPPSEGGVPRFEAKGIETVRRDQCRAASTAQQELLEQFFRQQDLSEVRRRFESLAGDLLRSGLSGPRFTDLVFHRECRFGTYRAENEDAPKWMALPPQATVAREQMSAAEGADALGPAFGERVAYAVARGPPGARLVDRCMAPHELEEGGGGCKNRCSDPSGRNPAPRAAPQLDRWYYVEKALLPAISRILHNDLLGIPPVDVSAWLRRVPRPSEATAAAAAAAGGFNSGLRSLLRRLCRICGVAEAARAAGVCGGCATIDVRQEAQRRANETKAVAEMLESRCADCAGAPLWRSCKAAAYCPVLSQRVAAAEDARRAAEEVRLLTACPSLKGRDTKPNLNEWQAVVTVADSQGDADVAAREEPVGKMRSFCGNFMDEPDIGVIEVLESQREKDPFAGTVPQPSTLAVGRGHASDLVSASLEEGAELPKSNSDVEATTVPPSVRNQNLVDCLSSYDDAHERAEAETEKDPESSEAEADIDLTRTQLDPIEDISSADEEKNIEALGVSPVQKRRRRSASAGEQWTTHSNPLVPPPPPPAPARRKLLVTAAVMASPRPQFSTQRRRWRSLSEFGSAWRVHG